MATEVDGHAEPQASGPAQVSGQTTAATGTGSAAPARYHRAGAHRNTKKHRRNISRTYVFAVREICRAIYASQYLSVITSAIQYGPRWYKVARVAAP